MRQRETDMNKPIFIIGCPRSGTTVTMDLLGVHRELAWVSNHVDRCPGHLHRTTLNRVYDIPLVGERLYYLRTRRSTAAMADARKVLPGPVEPWRFWNHYLTKFQFERGGDVSPRGRTPADLSPSEITKIMRAVESICTYAGKRRFLSKYTDFPRMAYLLAAFPDALFIHVHRDGRAVAASYLAEISEGRFGTWEEREWWLSGWPAQWREEWFERYRTPLAFSAFFWKYFVDAILADAEEIPRQQYLAVRYRDIVGAPNEIFASILRFCGLEACDRMTRLVERTDLQDMNRKWRERLSEGDQRVLNEIIHEPEFRALLD